MSTAVNADPIDWLLEHDSDNPGIRYFALIDLLDLPSDAAKVEAAHLAVMRTGPVPTILESQSPDGWWAKPGAGYSPKYRGTVWQVLMLAELGADPHDQRVRRGCQYLLDHSIAANGGFSAYQGSRPSGAFHCLNGNMLFALIRLGWLEDPRVQAALRWQVGAINGTTGSQYFRSGTSGPGFACGVNGGLPCAWGGNKAMRALLMVPPSQRDVGMQAAIDAGVDLLLSRNPVEADYPFVERVSSTWFKLGFPGSYWSDVLETVDILAQVGIAHPPALKDAVEWITGKQDDQGRWRLENSLNGKTWANIEQRGKPSKWITLRALRTLKRLGLYAPGE
jgi:hypothetical protein